MATRMLLARSALALTLASGCAATRTAAPEQPRTAAERPPVQADDADAVQLAERPPPQVDDIVAAQIAVTYPDLPRLARTLHDILDVRADRGDVRAILHDSRASTLLVFATPTGHASVRRLLADLVPAAS